MRLHLPWAVPTVAALGAVLLGPGLLEGGRVADFGVHAVVVDALADGLRQGELRRWTHLIGAGLPIGDLYPLPAHLLGAVLVWPLGLDAQEALSVVSSLAHLAMALGTAAVARRIAGEGWAALVGALALVEHGVHHESLGAFAIFHAALFHQALSTGAFLFAAAAMLDVFGARANEWPDRTPSRSARIWGWCAVATATHPIALVSVGTAFVGLVAVLALGRDASPARSAIVARDLVLGVLLGALLWLPVTLLLGEHGLHFGSTGVAAETAFRALVESLLPHLTWRLVLGAAAVGAVGAFASRRAGPVFAAALAVAPLLLYVSDVQMWSGLGRLGSIAGFPAQRMGGIAKPFLLAMAAFALAQAAGSVGAALAARARPRARSPRRALAVGLAALAAALAVRGLAPVVAAEASAVRRAQTAAFPPELDALVAWARDARPAEPGRVARVLFPQAADWQHAVAQRSGLPIANIGYAPGVAFREQLVDASPAALRRFDVRWIWRWEGAAAARGREGVVTVGPHALVPVDAWDGAFARVEGGEGRVRTVRLEPERIELDVAGPPGARVPVVLGMGWFPRWRAVDADGRPIPLAPVPAHEGSRVWVPRLEAPPGRVVLRCDRTLPEDLAGLAVFGLGVGGVAATVGARRSHRARRRARAAWIALARALRRRRRAAAAIVAASVALVLVGGAAWDLAGLRPARGVWPAASLVPTARVEVRAAGAEAWRPCAFSPIDGRHHCDGLGEVGLAMARAVSLAPAAWPSVVPSVGVWPRGAGVGAEFRFVAARRLAGPQRAVTHGPGAATLLVDGEAVATPDASGRTRFELPGRAGRVEATVLLRPTGDFFFVGWVEERFLGSLASR